MTRLWVRLSMAAAVVLAAGSLVGLLEAEAIYGVETTELADVATAQDLVTLMVLAPLLVVLGRRAAQGSLQARLVWFGVSPLPCTTV